MWVQFFFILPVCVVLLYLPGCLFSRALSNDAITVLATAPLVTVTAYALLGIVYGELGVYTSWATLVLPSAGAGLLCCLVAQKLRKWPQLGRNEIADELKTYVPYLIVAAVVCFLYHIKPLDGPNSFLAKTDNTYHLNLIAHNLNSGDWSMLHSTLYDRPDELATYYPAAWHIIPTILCQATGCTIPMSVNAFIATLLCPVIPTSAFFFMRKVFGTDNPFALRLGAVLPLAFVVYPWQILLEAKHPFFLGMTFLPVALALFIAVIEGALQREFDRRMLGLLAVALLACLLAHPSTAFSFGQLLGPYIVWVIWRESTAKGLTRKTCMRGILLNGAFVAFAVVLWLVCYRIPGLGGVTSYDIKPFAGVTLAVTEAGLLGFKNIPPEILLAIFMWLGILFSIYMPRYLWLVAGYAFACMQYVLTAISGGRLTHILTGFWYCDYKRVSAMACVMALPLAALGLEMCVRLCQKFFEMLTHPETDERDRRFAQMLVPVLAVGVAFVIVFYPSFKLPGASHKTPTAFGRVSKELSDWNSYKKPYYAVLTDDEVDFLEEVKEEVGSETVLNVPGDGSAFAYVELQIDVYFRRYGPFRKPGEGIIMSRLYDLASDAEVRTAVDESGARYVLLLDEDPNTEEASYFNNFGEGYWMGLLSIDEQTPGFELVLSEGDMRLYRIL